MVRISEHKLILNSAAGTYNASSPYDVTYNLQSFFNQFNRYGNLAKYRVGLDYFHFGSAVGGVDTVNVRLIGFVQNKNRTYMGTQQYNSDIIASIGAGLAGTSFNADPNPPKLVEGTFTSNGNVNVRFVDDLGAAINWNSGGTNSFQMNLIVIVESDE